MPLRMSSAPIHVFWSGLFVVLLIGLLCAPTGSILINPTLEDAFKFPASKGELEYSYFAEHPPILSEDEIFLLVLSTFPFPTSTLPSLQPNFVLFVGTTMLLVLQTGTLYLQLTTIAHFRCSYKPHSFLTCICSY